MRRMLTCAAACVVAVVCTAAAQPAAPLADGPPTGHLHARSVLPPGESGFYSTSAQAQYEADGDASDFGPHVDDQRAMYWSLHSKSADFQPVQGTPVEPAAGVRIYRDSHGIPLVYGDTAHDVWFGAGYAAATDRLFEIDAIRRTARGTLAELTGPSSVPADLQERTLTYTTAEYDRMLAQLSPAGRAAVTGYAAGVEARINEVQADSSLLPAEYTVLSTTPADWTVEDTLAAGVYITRFVASQGGLEMANVATLRELEHHYGRVRGRRAFQTLFPDDDPKAVTTVTGARFSNVPRGDRSAADRRHAFHRAARYAETIPLALTNGPGTGAAPQPTVPVSTDVQPPAAAARAADVVARIESWRRSLHGGSFAWAVSGRHTASGHAMLSSNPQLDYSYPSLLWELEVHGGGYDARGVGVPGIPTVGIGHTADVAWGLTTGYSKTIDSFIETTRPNPAAGGPPQYLHGGRWHDESCRTETVHYREAVNGVPVGPPSFSKDYRVCRTEHGPVVATSGRHARSVDYAQWKHDIDTVEGILMWNRAHSLADVAAGVRHVAWNENIVAADSRGHIGFWHPGRYFRRPAGVDQRFPLDGRGAADPNGFLPPRRMPHVVDPASGYVANWNTKPAAGWVDGDLSGSNTRPGGPANRVTVIRSQLRSARGLRQPDTMRIDSRIGEADMRAQSYLPALLRLRMVGGLPARQRRALRILARWDGRAYAPGAPGGSSPQGTAAGDVTDGPAATLFLALRNHIKSRLFRSLPAAVLARLDTIPTEGHQYDVTPLDNLTLRVIRPGWAGLPPPTVITGPRSPQRVLRNALAATLAALKAKYGAHPSRWHRSHAISHLESLTGVIGPAAVEPFQDRGSWVQQVAFTRGRRR
ncbi:MAG: penicillin amidase [Frankiaceae bacterium]|nr:penicillin amidase [Frankiaceae bacterium]